MGNGGGLVLVGGSSYSTYSRVVYISLSRTSEFLLSYVCTPAPISSISITEVLDLIINGTSYSRWHFVKIRVVFYSYSIYVFLKARSKLSV